MQLKLDSRFQQRARGMFERYQFQVGILQDGPHKEPDDDAALKTYVGGPARKASNTPGPLSLAGVSEDLRAKLGINFYTDPFKKTTSDIIRFTNEFFKLAFGTSQKKRAENLLQAVVRNPILRGDYGRNSKAAIKRKGFDRLMIDTAQLFKGIRAVCIEKGGRRV